MKTYNFNICKYNITITIEKKKFKAVDADEYIDNRIHELSEKLFEHGRNNGYPLTPNEIRKILGVNEPTEEIKMEEPERLCFMEAAEKYIESQREVLAPSTLKGYENIIEHHFNNLWLIWLDKLTEEHLQRAFDNEIEKGLSVKTLKGYKSFILKVLSEYRPDFHPNIRVTKEGVNENA